MVTAGFQPIKVGVIGTGRFGRLHALTLAGLFEFQLVAIVGRRPECPQPLRTELPDIPYWSSLSAAIVLRPGSWPAQQRHTSQSPVSYSKRA